jgi:hypothetical protein
VIEKDLCLTGAAGECTFLVGDQQATESINKHRIRNCPARDNAVTWSGYALHNCAHCAHRGLHGCDRANTHSIDV